MRRRILVLTLSTTILVVLAFVIPLAILVDRETTQRARLDLQSRAQATAIAIRAAWTVDQVRSYISAADTANHTSTRVTKDGTAIGTLPAGVDLPPFGGQSPGLGPGDPTGSGNPSGSGNSSGSGGSTGSGGQPGGPGALLAAGGGQVAFAFNRDANVFVAVYESDDRLGSGATGWFALIAGAGAFLLLVAALAAVFVSRRISAPLTATAEAAHRLSAGDIDARAPTTGPREVADVGEALNRLAGRIDELIDEERETVADLSHRLRTPLTAMRLDADTLRDADEAERIGEHVATLERTLTAVIRAARRAEREGLVPSCDATAVVAERTAFWSALAEDQGRTVRVTLPPRAVAVRAAGSDLGAAVDALVENVLAHTPEGTDFRVDLTATATGAELVVADRGPGIPDGAGVRGRSDRGSTGLGLSIAARCAENSGGSFAVERPPGGGVVRLVLGAP